MPISFFFGEGDLYANMDSISGKIDDETYGWLATRRIDLGRRASFPDAIDSPAFDTLESAEEWLRANWFLDQPRVLDVKDDEDVGSGYTPTEEDYEECARLAHEINEIAAMAKLSEILPLDSDHSFLCNTGIWFWKLGHKSLAVMAYKRSIELQPEAPTYFNLAVCIDDLGGQEPAKATMEKFYELVDSDEERGQAEGLLRAKGKAHLIRE
jgi:hypothetical protein